MRYLLLFFIFGFLLSCTCDSSSNDAKNSILRINDVPYSCRGKPGDEGCGDRNYWENIDKGREFIPNLINIIDDNKILDIPVPNFGGYYTVGDVAIFQIWEIERAFPLEKIIKNNIGFAGVSQTTGFWYYWAFVKENQKNRELLKQEVMKWWNP